MARISEIPPRVHHLHLLVAGFEGPTLGEEGCHIYAAPAGYPAVVLYNSHMPAKWAYSWQEADGHWPVVFVMTAEDLFRLLGLLAPVMK